MYYIRFLTSFFNLLRHRWFLVTLSFTYLRYNPTIFLHTYFELHSLLISSTFSTSGFSIHLFSCDAVLETIVDCCCWRSWFHQTRKLHDGFGSYLTFIFDIFHISFRYQGYGISCWIKRFQFRFHPTTADSDSTCLHSNRFRFWLHLPTFPLIPVSIPLPPTQVSAALVSNHNSLWSSKK